MNKKLFLILLSSLSLLLSGFDSLPIPRYLATNVITIRETIEVKADGSGTLLAELGLSEDAINSVLENNQITVDSLCTNFNQTVLKDFITFEQVKRGKETWCVGSKSFKTLKDMKEFLTDDLNETIHRLEIVDNRFFFDVDSSGYYGKTSSGDYTLKPEFILKVPGDVGENNATKVSGRTLTWDLASKDLPSHLRAESAVGGGFLGLDPTLALFLSMMMCGCCCVLILIIAGVVLLLVLRRKKQTPQTSESTPSGSPATANPGDTV